jgi:hypothetical protein
MPWTRSVARCSGERCDIQVGEILGVLRNCKLQGCAKKKSSRTSKGAFENLRHAGLHAFLQVENANQTPVNSGATGLKASGGRIARIPTGDGCLPEG